jgi:lysophospholipase L1-like esterase
MSTNLDQNTPVVRPRRTRWLALFAVGITILLVGGLWIHFRFSRPVGNGPAGPVVAGDAFAKPWSVRKVVLLGLGDSVTQGLGASMGSHSYFQRLHRNPSDEFPDIQGICLSSALPNLEARNLAISGTTSIECLDYQFKKLVPYDEDVFGIIVMTTGGNDVIHNYGRTPPREGAMYGARFDEVTEWVSNYSDRLDEIARRIRDAFPGGCHIFIANIYDPTDGDGDITNAGLPAWPDGVKVLGDYNDAIARFAKRSPDVTLVDMRAAFLGHGIHCTHFWHHAYCSTDPHYWYWDNLEDPNDRGYDAVRLIFLIEMARVLPERLR